MHNVSLIFALPGAIAAIALLAIFVALHGRRIDKHPLCRRCGYDLFNKAEATTVCTECGASLGRRRAIRIGHRQKLRGVIWLATPILLICLGWEGLNGLQRAKLVDWNQRKPVWLLVREAHEKYAPACDAALVELTRRISVNQLPTERETALVDEAFVLQADVTRPWRPGWGDLIEAARGAGRVDDSRWWLYFFNGYQLKLEVDANDMPCRPCDDLPLQFARDVDRLGTKTVYPAWFAVGIYAPESAGLSYVEIAGHKARWKAYGQDESNLYVEEHDGMKVVDGDIAPSGRSFRKDLNCQEVDDWASVREGAYTANTSLVLMPVPGFRSDYASSTPTPTQPPRARNLLLNCPVTFVAGPVLTKDQSLAPTIATTFDASFVMNSRDWSHGGVHWVIACTIHCHKPPVDICSRAFFRAAGSDQFPSASAANAVLYCPKGQDVTETVVGDVSCQSEGALTLIDVELRPEVTESPSTTKQMWGESILLKNVHTIGKKDP